MSNDPQKEIVKSDVISDGSPVKTDVPDHNPSKEGLNGLTVKNKTFLNCLLKGMSTMQAYKSAGYKGDQSAAYDLRYRLKNQLNLLVEGKGLDRAGILFEWSKLLDLPIDPNETYVSVDQKVKILNGVSKLLPHPKEESSKPTPFLVQVFTDKKDDKVISITSVAHESDKTSS